MSMIVYSIFNHYLLFWHLQYLYMVLIITFYSSYSFIFPLSRLYIIYIYL